MEEEPEILIAVPEAVHHTLDGSVLEIGVYGNVESEQRRTEILCEGYGVDASQISAEGDTHSRGARMSVGFRKWRSTWDPHANNINPSLN